MRRYAKQVANEVKLGLQDNLNGIKQLFLHPIVSVMSFVDIFKHPIRTAKGIYHFATKSPIRFGTNIGVSILEGQVASWSWGKISTLGQTTALETEILTSSSCPLYANATLPVTQEIISSSPTFLNYFVSPTQGMAPLPSGPMCTPTSCMLPTSVHSGSSLLGNSNAVVNTTTQIESERKRKNAHPN